MQINPVAVLMVILTTTVGFLGGVMMGNATVGAATGLATGCAISLLCEFLG